jgi:DNA-binding response OmpR family regulator
MSGKRILLVEDSDRVLDFNRRLLESRGYVVETAMTLAAARKSIALRRPDAIVLDIGMPDGSGLDFLREFRRTSQIPVLLLTGYDKDDDIVAGFESDCDDYLPKPYTFNVLLARLKNLLHSAERVPEAVAKGPLLLDVVANRAFLSGEDMLLTQKEFSLLLLFAQNEDRTVSAEYLYEKIWGSTVNNDVRALKQQLSNLRGKLKGSGYTVVAVRGEGYCFEAE